MRLIKRLFTRRKTDGYFFLRIKEITGLKPRDPLLYQLAFRHSSATLKHQKQGPVNNQRLEFLGDAILDAVVADLLYTSFPNKPEGFLTITRSKLVSRKKLNQLARDLALPDLIISRLPASSLTDQILGNTLEALIGAVYLDYGFAGAKLFITRLYAESLSRPDELIGDVISFKSLLQEYAQKEKHSIKYELLKADSVANDVIYVIGLYLDDELIGSGNGLSKKTASEQAAKNACQKLNVQKHG
jgi:ribonuclease-3